MGWGSSMRWGGGRKLRALPRKFVFIGFRRESGMSWEFCRDVPDSWGCSKSLCKKTSCAFFVPCQRRKDSCISHPVGPARHLDALRQKLTPHCLAATFDLRSPSPELSLKLPPKLPLPAREGFCSSFKIAPPLRVIARQLSGNN